MAKRSTKAEASEPVLLSGGNPQIAKGDGDAPIRVYVAAMPGWTRAVGERLDALIEQAAPGVKKAVKWNSPFYGAAGGTTWFLSFHVFAKYVKVAFFEGAELDPPPPVASKQKAVRYFHIHADETIDEDRFTDWVRQANRLPGIKL